MLTVPARPLGDDQRAAVERLLDQAPYAGAQIAERVGVAGLDWWRREAAVLGYAPRGRLESVCWVGGNVVPVLAQPFAVAAFADLIADRPRPCSSLVGTADAVLNLWERLIAEWGPARDVRAHQPLLVATAPPPIPADSRYRLVRPTEINQLYPAAVAMYTEEVGVSPVAGLGDQSYRDRVADLVHARRAYARFHEGRVVFKAELAIVTRHTAQIQGVWTAPEWRGRGIATTGVATVVADVLRRVAPSVSLYVNDYNDAARRVYARCGFRQVGEFATVLLGAAGG